MDEHNSNIPSAYEPMERGDLAVSSRTKKKKTVVVILLGVLAVVVVLVSIFLASRSGEPEPELEKAKLGLNQVSGVDKGSVGNNLNWFEEIKNQREKQKQRERDREAYEQRERERLERLKLAEEARPKTVMKTNVEKTQPTPTVSSQSSGRNKNAPPTPEERRLTGGVIVPVAGGKNQYSQGSMNQQNGGYDSSFDAPTFANGVAGYRGADGLDFLLKHGSIIPCALYTQIISDYQGYVTCRVTQDVYSANGKALLIERGSLVSGSQRVELEPGKNRVFTTWADVETPNGISLNINSLGAGRLGASGNEAWIDNHFKERFGGAILLSFIDDGFTALANKASENNSSVNFDNSTDTAESIAEKALDSSINIKPTGYTQIGQRINIIVARDIDMSTVYEFQ